MEIGYQNEKCDSYSSKTNGNNFCSKNFSWGESKEKLGDIVDIILPKKRDKYNNTIALIKVKQIEVPKIIDFLKEKIFLGVKIGL